MIAKWVAFLADSDLWQPLRLEQFAVLWLGNPEDRGEVPYRPHRMSAQTRS